VFRVLRVQCRTAFHEIDQVFYDFYSNGILFEILRRSHYLVVADTTDETYHAIQGRWGLESLWRNLSEACHFVSECAIDRHSLESFKRACLSARLRWARRGTVGGTPMSASGPKRIQ